MQVWDNLRADVKTRIEKYSNRAIQMATTNSINLQKLSPKKKELPYPALLQELMKQL